MTRRSKRLVLMIAQALNANFRKLGKLGGGTLFWGPYNKDPTIKGAILGSPEISETLRRDFQG